MFNIIISDASAQRRSIKKGNIIKASLLLMPINTLPREAAKKSQDCNKRYQRAFPHNHLLNETNDKSLHISLHVLKK